MDREDVARLQALGTSKRFLDMVGFNAFGRYMEKRTERNPPPHPALPTAAVLSTRLPRDSRETPARLPRDSRDGDREARISGAAMRGEADRETGDLLVLPFLRSRSDPIKVVLRIVASVMQSGEHLEKHQVPCVRHNHHDQANPGPQGPLSTPAHLCLHPYADIPL